MNIKVFRTIHVLLLSLLALAATAQSQQSTAQPSPQTKPQSIDMAAATPLDRAAYLGQMDKVKYFLEMGALPDGYDVNGNTPIYCAIAGGHPDIARFLIDSSSQTERNAELFPAVSKDEMAVVQYLVAHGADVNARRDVFRWGDQAWGGGDTPLIDAANAGHLDMVRFLVADGSDVNTKDVENETALEVAVDKNDLEIAKVLLDHGADPNASPLFGGTLLTRTVDFDDLAMMEALVTHGADVNAKDQLKETALDQAQYGKHPDIKMIQFLVTHGADVNEVSGTFGDTPLVSAVQMGNLDAVQFLVAHGANIDAQSVAGSALRIAVREGRLDIVQFLVAHGADVNAQDGGGDTALSSAIFSHQQKIVDYLRAHGAH